jgi:uncharacterized protein (TIGR00369 family)
MSDVAQAVQAAKRSGDFAPLVQAIPYLQFLGVRVETRDGRRVAVMPFAEHLVGNPTVPALHGGTLGGLLESMAHLEFIAGTEFLRLPKTITLTIDYMRSGKTRDVFAAAKIVKHGRRVTTLHCHAWQDDENAPIASATVHLKVSG